MTDQIKAELLVFGETYFSIPKGNWTPEELGLIYAMYNKIHGTNKKDQGCGSCRRDTIMDVKNNWMTVKSQLTQPGSIF